MSKIYIPMGSGSNSSNRPPAALRKLDKIRKYRKEAARLAAIANKRVERLSTSEFKSSPAYQKWLSEGGEKFSIRGKDYNQVQKEMARIRSFIDSQTSTITGVKNNLKQIAEHTGIKYKSVQELKAKSETFFELASKVEQYLTTVEQMGSAIGYQKIWQAINEYVQDESIDLSNTVDSVDSMVEAVSKALTAYETPVQGTSNLFIKLYDEKE